MAKVKETIHDDEELISFYVIELIDTEDITGYIPAEKTDRA